MIWLQDESAVKALQYSTLPKQAPPKPTLFGSYGNGVWQMQSGRFSGAVTAGRLYTWGDGGIWPLAATFRRCGNCSA